MSKRDKVDAALHYAGSLQMAGMSLQGSLALAAQVLSDDDDFWADDSE